MLIDAFGKRIRTLRKEKGLSMEEFAALCEVEYRQIGKIERGETNPTLNTISILAEVLEISLSDLMDFEYSAPVDKDAEEQKNEGH
ncbi:MAG: helix-turn-helix transcriptional regulator [Bacteroidota bacterium]